MKKLTLFFMALLVFNVSFAKEKEKIDTTFTFQGYSPTSSSSIRVSPRTKITKNSKISYPSFIGGANSDIVKNMNAIMENFISRYKSTKHVSYSTSYEVTAENSLFLSVLFTINLTDNDTGQKTVLHNAISYNLKSGKQLWRSLYSILAYRLDWSFAIIYIENIYKNTLKIIYFNYDSVFFYIFVYKLDFLINLWYY